MVPSFDTSPQGDFIQEGAKIIEREFFSFHLYVFHVVLQVGMLETKLGQSEQITYVQKKLNRSVSSSKDELYYLLFIIDIRFKWQQYMCEKEGVRYDAVQYSTVRCSEGCNSYTNNHLSLCLCACVSEKGGIEMEQDEES